MAALGSGQKRYIRRGEFTRFLRMILYKIFFRLHAKRLPTFVLALMALATAAQPIEFATLMPAPNIQPAPELPRSAPPESGLHPARQALALKPIHDETNPAHQQLQRIDEATSHLPHDALGFPDWMASLRSGAITPRAGLSDAARMNVLDLDVVMKNTKEMPNVLFPHRAHTLWLDCSNCHPAPFVPKAGANPVSMGEIFQGRYCGMCHDRVAFITFFSCTRCHSVPQGAKLEVR